MRGHWAICKWVIIYCYRPYYLSKCLLKFCWATIWTQRFTLPYRVDCCFKLRWGKFLSLILFCHFLLNNLSECLLDSSLWVLGVNGVCVIHSYKIFLESLVCVFFLFPHQSIEGQFAICCKNFINAPIFSSFSQEWSVQIICSLSCCGQSSLPSSLTPPQLSLCSLITAFSQVALLARNNKARVPKSGWVSII